jgi:hypothetical protein
MRKLVVVAAFAAVALTAQSAAACDWNREASTEQQQVAMTAAPAPQTTSTAVQAPVVASDSTSKPVQPAAPVMLVNDRH